MVGFLLTGHGSYGAGILSGIGVVAGQQEQMVAVDFTDNDTTESLTEKVKAAIDNLGTDEILCFCDIAGGTPFRVCSGLTETMNVGVVSGASVAMVLACVFEREQPLEALTDFAVQAGVQGIQKYEKREFVQQESDDGI